MTLRIDSAFLLTARRITSKATYSSGTLCGRNYYRPSDGIYAKCSQRTGSQIGSEWWTKSCGDSPVPRKQRQWELISAGDDVSDEFTTSSIAPNDGDGEMELQECVVALAKEAIATTTQASERPIQMPDIRRFGPATRYFENRDDSSSKFWEITLDGTRHSVRFGRIGSAGQLSSKEFTDENQANLHSERLIREKLSKGYREVK
jgi:predicted DNA-binding WGR domain protein